MSYTLAGWKNSTIQLVVLDVPLQDNESATILVSTYLSDVGGWVPDDPTQPVGEGVPANGAYPEEAAAQIATQQYSRMYEIDSTEAVTIRLKYNTNFAADQPDSAVMAASREAIEALISTQLEDTILELVTVEPHSHEIINRGFTTDADRRYIQSQIELDKRLIDPKAIALVVGRNYYLLDTTYNVASVYTEEEKELVVSIRKYTDTNYTVLDKTAANRYVLTLDSVYYTLATGLVLPLTE